MSDTVDFYRLRDAVEAKDYDGLCLLLKSAPSLPREVAMEQGERLCVRAALDGSAEILQALCNSSQFGCCYVPDMNTDDACREIAKAHNAKNNYPHVLWTEKPPDQLVV